MKLTGKIIPKNLFKSTKNSQTTPFPHRHPPLSTPPLRHRLRNPNLTTLQLRRAYFPRNSHNKSTSSDNLSFFGDVQYELLQPLQILDTDNRRITRSELKTLLSWIRGSEPVTDEELTVMVNEIDVDDDGSISFEIGVISVAFGLPSCDDELRGVFEECRCMIRGVDADHDGLITAEELYEVFKLIGDGAC
ncbi:putative EF-hand domain pair protein CML [Helianthus anomalus]